MIWQIEINCDHPLVKFQESWMEISVAFPFITHYFFPPGRDNNTNNNL